MDSSQALSMYDANQDSTTEWISGVDNLIKIYADTSNKKSDRLVAIIKAKAVLEHICNAIEPDNYVANMMYKGFDKILSKATEAEKYPDELQDFKQEIAFLNVIKG